MNRKKVTVCCRLLAKVFDEIDEILMYVKQDIMEESFIKNHMDTIKEYTSMGFKIMNTIEDENNKEEIK